MDLGGILRNCRKVVEERGAAPLIGLFDDEKALFSEGDRDIVWRHLSENGVCCVRVIKRHKHPNTADTHFIIVARNDTALDAHLRQIQGIIA